MARYDWIHQIIKAFVGTSTIPGIRYEAQSFGGYLYLPVSWQKEGLRIFVAFEDTTPDGKRVNLHLPTSIDARASEMIPALSEFISRVTQLILDSGFTRGEFHRGGVINSRIIEVLAHASIEESEAFWAVIERMVEIVGNIEAAARAANKAAVDHLEI